MCKSTPSGLHFICRTWRCALYTTNLRLGVVCAGCAHRSCVSEYPCVSVSFLNNQCCRTQHRLQRPHKPAMTRFGLATLSASSHINGMMELALELKRRGHEVVFFTGVESKDKIEKVGFETVIVGETDIKEGNSLAQLSRIGQLQGLAAIKCTIDLLYEACDKHFRTAPDAIRAANVDLLIIDQIAIYMPSIAEYLEIPYVIVCVALMLSLDNRFPPIQSHHIPSNTWFSQIATYLENRLNALLMWKINGLIRRQRLEWKLPMLENVTHPNGRGTLAYIIQFPRSVDFCGEYTPKHYHYIGRLRDPSGKEPMYGNVAFPFEKLDGRALIYASFGTIQNRIKERYQMVIDSCRGIEAQLVLSLGDREADCSEFEGGDAIVVPFAPQEQLVSMATLVITHGGNNTATMAMSHGVPMVVIAIANDQPGVGARVQNAGLGVSIVASRLTVGVLRKSIVEVMNDERFRERSQLVKKEIEEAGGVLTAAGVVEKAAVSAEARVLSI